MIDVAVAQPPPAPLREYQPAPPFANAVWIAGYWRWSGFRYAWVAGRWSARPEGFVWEPHRWMRSPDGRWREEPGRWRR
jgi:hypothetical protein